MKVLEKLETQIRNSYPGLVFHLDCRTEWGSENPGYREEIRKGILEFLKKSHPDQIADSIWDLNTPPVLKSFFVSISHCQGLGGFAFSAKPLGLDIELKSRLSPQLIERISTAEERQKCPQAELIWVAKEALFKCTTEFYTIGHIHIESWAKSQDETYEFSCLNMSGYASLDLSHACAIALKKQ